MCVCVCVCISIILYLMWCEEGGWCVLVQVSGQLAVSK